MRSSAAFCWQPGTKYALASGLILSLQLGWMFTNFFNYFYAIPQGIDQDISTLGFELLVNFLLFIGISLAFQWWPQSLPKARRTAIALTVATLLQFALLWLALFAKLLIGQWVTWWLNAIFIVLFVANYFFLPNRHA